MSVDLTRADGVVRILLNRPEKKNAMSDAMWDQLERHLATVSADAGDRVLIISGAGGAFCGGSDVDGLLDDLPSLPGRIDVSNRCVLAIAGLSIPTIAQVDGIAAGSALNLALACDFVYASERARFGQVFIHIGLSLDSGASWLLPRLVGERVARELALLGEIVPAERALALGMINDVVGGEDLAGHVDGIATRLAALNPAALAGNKELFAHAWHRDLATALRAETDNQMRVIDTEHARALINQFSKRSGAKPVADSQSATDDISQRGHSDGN